MRSPYLPPDSAALETHDQPRHSRPVTLWAASLLWMFAGAVELVKVLPLLPFVLELRSGALLRVALGVAVPLFWVLGAALLLLMKRSSVVFLASACALEIGATCWNPPPTALGTWLPLAVVEWLFGGATVVYAAYLARKGQLA